MSPRPRPRQGNVLVLDTEGMTVRVERDRDDGVFLVLTDRDNWVELPVTCPAEYMAAQRLANAVFQALIQAAPHDPDARATGPLNPVCGPATGWPVPDAAAAPAPGPRPARPGGPAGR